MPTAMRTHLLEVEEKPQRQAEYGETENRQIATAGPLSRLVEGEVTTEVAAKIATSRAHSSSLDEREVGERWEHWRPMRRLCRVRATRTPRAVRRLFSQPPIRDLSSSPSALTTTLLSSLDTTEVGGRNPPSSTTRLFSPEPPPTTHLKCPGLSESRRSQSVDGF